MEQSLTYVKEFLCEMTEKEYPKGTSFGRSRCGAKPLVGLCAVLTQIGSKEGKVRKLLR